MKTWIKLYTEILDDPKLGTLSLADRGAWMMLLALAGKLDHHDDQGNATGRLDTLEYVAWHLRLPADQIAPAIQRLQAAGMLHDQDGILYVTHYTERQETVTDAERARAYRQRKAQQAHHAAPDATGQDTRAPSRKRHEAVTQRPHERTERDTESESDKESDSDPEQTTTDTERASRTRDAVADAGAPTQSTHRAVAKSAPESVSSVQSVSKSVCATDADSLRAAGVTEPALSNILGRNLPPGAIQEWIDYANRQPHLKNKAGFLVAILTRPGPYAKPPPYRETPATGAKPKTWFTEEEYERFFLHHEPVGATPRTVPGKVPGSVGDSFGGSVGDSFGDSVGDGRPDQPVGAGLAPAHQDNEATES
jgi:hypothetical protein